MKKIILLISFIFFTSSIAWTDDSIKIACPNGINPNKSLLKTTIIKHKSEKDSYDPSIVYENTDYRSKIINENGKCFHFSEARFEYLVDNKHAIYSMFIDENYDGAYRLFLFDFGTSTPKWTKIGGIIKTTGEYYHYKDNKNVPRIMPRVIVVKGSKI
ncbi:MAG: hypothetical protein ABSC11_15405 [Smithella sp.]|jgi:hypothetical protein